VRSPEPTMIARGFAAGAFLMLVVLILFVIARVVGGHGPGHVSGRRGKRLKRASAHEASRFAHRAEQRQQSSFPHDLQFGAEAGVALIRGDS
jgi:hypothetical protein